MTNQTLKRHEEKSYQKSSADFMALKKALTIKNNELQINVTTFKKAFSDFLTKNFHQQNKVIKIDNAVLTENTEEQTLSVSGKSSYLNIPSMPVTARFSFNNEGDVVSSLTYTLISKSQSSLYWKFSRSFPGLPIESDSKFNSRLTKRPEAFLDKLQFNEAYYVINSHPQMEPNFKVELGAGVNFIGDMIPVKVLGVIGNLLDPKQSMTVYGLLNIPRPNQKFQPKLKSDMTAAIIYPWDLASEIPGIHLEAKVDKKINIGKVEFRDPTFRIFYPLSDDWMGVGDFFAPVKAFTGNFELGSKADLALTMKIDTKADILSVEAKCDGISLTNLAQLANVTGSDKLMSQLPDALTSVTKTLGKIELMDLAFTVAYGKTGLYIAWATFSLGIPDVTWKVWGDHVVVTAIGFRFSVYSPFTRPQFGVDLWGKTEIEGVPLEIKASKSEGYVLMVKLGEAQTIPLKQYMKKMLPSVPPLPDLTIDDFMLMVAPRRFYQISGSLANKPNSWDIDVGPTKLKFSDVRFDFMLMQSGQKSGSFGGTIEFGKNVRLTSQYTIPGQFSIEATCDRMNFYNLTSKLNQGKPVLPKGFDFTLINSSIIIKKEQTSNVFQLMSTVEKLGTFAFEARRVSGKWGIAGGLSLDAKPSSLPGLSFLKPLEKVVQLEDLLLIVATFEAVNFRFPDAAQFSNQTMSSSNIQMPQQAQGLIAGLNLYAKWRLDTSKKEQKLLKQAFGLNPTMAVAVQIGTSANATTRMFFSYETNIGKMPLSCKVGVGLTKEKTEFFLIGSMQTKIQKQIVTFDVAMSFVATGAFLAGTMDGTVKFNGFQLSNLALMIGINWSGIPSLGIAATLNVSKFQSSMAIFFDSTNPAQSLVAGSVSDLSLKDVVDTFVGKAKASSIDKPLAKVSVKGTQYFDIDVKLAADLDQLKFDRLAAAFRSKGGITIPSNSSQLHLVVAKKGQLWYLTDKTTMRYYQLRKRGKRIEASIQAQFYCAPMDTYIGTKRFPQGYFINCAIKFLGFDAFVRVDISMYKGIAIDAQMDKIVLVNENIYSITAAKGKGGPRISVATFSQPKHKVKAFRLPHFYINGKSQLLGIVQKTYVSLTIKGLEFNLKGPLAPAVNFDVKGVINGSKGLEAGGTVKVGLGTIDLGKLGKVKIKTDAQGTLSVKVGGKKIGATAKASFQALGQKHSIATFKLNTKTKALVNLAETMAKEAAKVLSNFFKDAAKWTNAVGKGMVDGVEDTGKVLKDTYKQTAGQAAKLMKNAGSSAEDLTKMMKDVYKTSPRDIAKTLKGVRVPNNEVTRALKVSGVSGDDIGDALRYGLGLSSNASAKLMKGAGYTMDSIGNSLKSAYKLDYKDMTKVLKGAGYATRSVDKYVGKSYKAALAAAKKAEEAARKKAAEAKKKAEAAARKKAAEAKKKAEEAKRKAAKSTKKTGKKIKGAFKGKKRKKKRRR